MNAKRGLTLLEVIVALLLMGGVVVSSLLAFARHREQLFLAGQRIEATGIADQMLAELSARRGGLPVGVRGAVEGKPQWFWQTRPIGTTSLATVPMQVVRFEIRSRNAADDVLVGIDSVKAVSP